MARLHTWTPRTEGGFLNEEFDQILAVLNALDTDYLRLDGTNDGNTLSFLFGDLTLDTDKDISAIGSSVSLLVGQTTSGKNNLMLSRSKIQARVATGTVGTLYLNPLGGTVSVGGALTAASTLAVTTSGTIAGNTIWHAGNDGAGSGLDADKVDGYEAASLLPGPRFIPAYAFYPGGGATASTVNSTLPAISLPNSGTPYAEAFIGIHPEQCGRSVTVRWLYTWYGICTGYFRVDKYAVGYADDAADITAVGSATSATVFGPSGAGRLKYTQSTVTTGSSDIGITLRFARDSAHAGDTSGCVCYFLGALVT